MNTIVTFLLEIVLTLVVVTAIVGSLRPFLRKTLLDLCGTEDRAQFWTAFSNILLIGMPAIFALTYKPKAKIAEELFLEVASKLSGNLGALLFALTGVGLIVAFFALVAPRPAKGEAK